MFKSHSYYGSFLLLTGLLLACSCATTLTPSPVPEEALVLFRDEFSTTDPDWALFDTREGASYVQQGELYLEDRGKGIGVYTHLIDHSWEDVVVTARVRQVEGTQNNWMGILCRQQDEENYYLFAISADGYYVVLKVVDGLSTPLAGPSQHEAINAGRATNQLTVMCAGDQLHLQVNDTALVSHTETTFTEGNVALLTDAVEPGALTTVAFDAFVITAP